MYRAPPSQSARKSIHCCATDFLWHIYGCCRCCRELFSHKIPFVNHLSLCRRLAENENHITTCSILQHQTRHKTRCRLVRRVRKLCFISICRRHRCLTDIAIIVSGFSVVIALHRKNRAYVCLLVCCVCRTSSGSAHGNFWATHPPHTQSTQYTEHNWNLLSALINLIIIVIIPIPRCCIRRKLRETDETRTHTFWEINKWGTMTPKTEVHKRKTTTRKSLADDDDGKIIIIIIEMERKRSSHATICAATTLNDITHS